VGWRPNGEAAVLRIGRGFLAVMALCLALAAPAQAVTPLRTIVEDVPGAAGYRYQARDDLGNSMDTLKVVKSPFGGYIGVYHTSGNGEFAVKVATSVDLLNWTFQANLAPNASQPTIHNLPQGAALVAYESHVGCGGASHCLGLRYYATESALLNGAASRRVILPRKLSSCAEGTPNIFAAKADLSSIDIGFHYFSGCTVDREARGRLLNFSPASWSAWASPNIDLLILAAGASPEGHIGDRDGNFYDGAYQRLYEGQIAPLTSWRSFLLAKGSATQLAIRTHKGSRGFANPTYTVLSLPNGQPGMVVTQYLTLSGAQPGEAGELVYYRPINPPPAPPPPPGPDPVIAAAGDISCANVVCNDDETSNLLVAERPTKVLTLGDNQYEHGELQNFQTYYEPDWGRVKDITMPSPGNHDPPSSGYGSYFGAPPNYSFGLGAWHLISLDSTGIPAATAFLESDLAQHSNQCVLAYWHHPRFSSDASHGNNTAISGFWTRLYGARADVVLVGHAHTYERFAPQTPAAELDPTGIRQFVVGTGGKALHSFGTVRANSEVRIGGVHGVLRMTLRPTSYEWRFQGENGTIYDSGSGDCV
jgi:hypothetical protein